MRKIFFLLLLSVMPLAAMQDPSVPDPNAPNERFAAANQLFEKGELDKAGDIYQALIAQGFQSAELYYNLGNLHYRRGERGKAVLWYERALRISPRDGDIQFNLSLATSHIKDADASFVRRIFTTFTLNELSVVLMILSWVFFGVLAARALGWTKSDLWPSMTMWLSGSLLMIVGAWFGVALTFQRQPSGVVINPPGEVRNGPGNDYAVGFTIPEGSHVLLLNRRPDWTQVGVPHQGLKGWIPNSEVEAVEITSASLS